MPNCDFYALRNDHAKVLDFVLSESGCKIYEMYSALGCEIREFTNMEDILAEIDRGPGRNKVLLSLYSPTMCGEFKFRRIEVSNKEFPSGTYRYDAHGWGAIQLYLGGMHEGKLWESHTNHNSEKRATAWAPLYSELGSPTLWDWGEVTRISSRINRFIRKIAVSKKGGRPILSEAFEWSSNGGSLG